MLCSDGPRLIEYNARFGDPEAMNVLPLLKTKMVDICNSIVNEDLENVEFIDKASVCKYIVQMDIPNTEYTNTKKVEVDEDKIKELGANVFYAAVNQKDDGIYLSGSRALGIVGQGETISEAENVAEKSLSICNRKYLSQKRCWN